MLLKALRNTAGYTLVLADRLTRPKKTQRSNEAQQKAQNAIAGHSLYQLYACPFCIKTRRAISTLNLEMDIRDINKNPQHREALHAGGGRVKVPCLRVEEGDDVRWIYESNAIIDYLQQRVS